MMSSKFWPAWRVVEGPMESYMVEGTVDLPDSNYKASHAIPKVYLKHVTDKAKVVRETIEHLEHHLRSVWLICGGNR